jgi:hypothetical protein
LSYAANLARMHAELTAASAAPDPASALRSVLAAWADYASRCQQIADLEAELFGDGAAPA